MHRPRILLLYAAGTALVVAGAVPMVSRWYSERQHQSAFERQRDAVLAEAAEQKAELAAKKPQLLAELGALQAAGEHEKVLALAGKYRLADDKDIRAIYTRSTMQVSFKQTMARMSALAQAQCTPATAVDSARDAFAEAFPEAPVSTAVGWFAQKLDTTAYLPQIRERLHTLLDAEHHETEDEHERRPAAAVLEALRGERPRVQPFVMYRLRSADDASLPICVWQVTGTWVEKANADGAKPFELILWLAPAGNERMMTRDVLSLRGL